MNRLAAADKLSDAWNEIVRESLEHTDLFFAGAAGYNDLEPKEKLRFNWLIGMVFGYLQNFHEKYRAGAIGQVEWNQHYNVLLWYLAWPGMSGWWDDERRVYAKPFADLIGSSLEGFQDGTIVPPTDVVGLYLSAPRQS